jgi:hypothetical protein
MMPGPYFEAEDAPQLPPLGVCAACGKNEDPMVAVFWKQDADGCGLCPECSGQAPSEGYRHYVLLARKDRGGELPMMHGPYSAGEAERMRSYFLQLGNVASAEIVKPEGE